MNKELLAYILISIVFLVVFGGIASVLPSRKARQLGNLRMTARKYGISTSLVYIDDVNASMADRVTASGKKLDPKKRCISWSKPFAEDSPYLPEWITYAIAQEESSEVNWELHETSEESGSLSETYWDEVDRIKTILPERCIAIECSPSEVRWLGYEKVTSTIDEFIQAMVQGLDSLICLNTSISNERNTLKKRLDLNSEYD